MSALELERIAGVIGELDDFVALVMMAQDYDAPAEPCFRGGDASIHLFVREAEISFGQRLALGDVLFFVRREHGDEHVFVQDRLCETFRKLHLL